MKYWEIEFECDDSWSVSGIYSFFMKQETEPTIEDIKRVHGIYPNKDGLGNIVRIIDITDEGNWIYDGQIIHCPCCGEEIIIEFSTARCKECGWFCGETELDDIMEE